MAYRIIYHPKAEAELDNLYADIAVEGGTRTAGDFIDGVITFIERSKRSPNAAQCGKVPSPACELSATDAASAWRSRCGAMKSSL